MDMPLQGGTQETHTCDATTRNLPKPAVLISLLFLLVSASELTAVRCSSFLGNSLAGTQVKGEGSAHQYKGPQPHIWSVAQWE